MSKPTVVILAAGQNSRFFPLATDIHKEAITLLGESLLLRTLRNLEQHDFSKIVIVISPQEERSEKMKKLLVNFSTALNIEFVTQAEPQGMGDAVLTAKHLLGEQFAVIRPGLMTAGEILDQLLAEKEANVLCGMPTQEPGIYGIFQMEGDRAVALIEKPKQGEEPSNIKIEVVYLLSSKYLQILEQTPPAEYAFETALNTLMQQQSVKVVKFDHEPPTLKYPWHLFTFQQQLFSQLKSYRGNGINIAPTAVIDESAGAVYVADEVTIGHNAKVVGPCYIGKHSLVGDFTLIRQSSIEENCRIGAFSEVARSIIMSDTAMHLAYVADSIVGSRVNIGAGIITANKRFDNKTVKVLVKEEMVDSRLKKFGTIIGDEANIGISVRTMPGVFIGAQSVIFPSQTVFKHVDNGQTLK